MAGAFAPLAFGWLVLGYRQQGDELRQNTAALEQQSQEFQDMVDAATREREFEQAQRTLPDYRRLAYFWRHNREIIHEMALERWVHNGGTSLSHYYYDELTHQSEYVDTIFGKTVIHVAMQQIIPSLVRIEGDLREIVDNARQTRDFPRDNQQVVSTQLGQDLQALLQATIGKFEDDIASELETGVTWRIEILDLPAVDKSQII